MAVLGMMRVRKARKNELGTSEKPQYEEEWTAPFHETYMLRHVLDEIAHIGVFTYVRYPNR